jgi:antitoxin FitA
VWRGRLARETFEAIGRNGARRSEIPPGCAINDFSAIVDCMASITIRQLPETTKRKLRIRAAQHGRSMEQEAREILNSELSRPEDQPKDLGKAIRDLFAPFGGVDLQIPPREPIPEPEIK